jgi:hypothetical protein
VRLPFVRSAAPWDGGLIGTRAAPTSVRAAQVGSVDERFIRGTAVG